MTRNIIGMARLAEPVRRVSGLHRMVLLRLKVLTHGMTDFDIVNCTFLDGDVRRSTSYGVYISQMFRFARMSSHIDDFNTRNTRGKGMAAKLLRQRYRQRYHKLRESR